MFRRHVAREGWQPFIEGIAQTVGHRSNDRSIVIGYTRIVCSAQCTFVSIPCEVVWITFVVISNDCYRIGSHDNGVRLWRGKSFVSTYCRNNLNIRCIGQIINLCWCGWIGCAVQVLLIVFYYVRCIWIWCPMCINHRIPIYIPYLKAITVVQVVLTSLSIRQSVVSLEEVTWQYRYLYSRHDAIVGYQY